MKSKKSLLLAVLGILMITASIMYRKYRRAALREQKMEIQREEAKKLMEYQRKQDSIKRKKEFDSIQAIELKAFDSKLNEVDEKRRKLEETMKKLQEEAKKNK